MRDAEEIGEAASVCSFSDAGATQEDPPHVAVLRIFSAWRNEAKGCGVVRRRVGTDFGGQESPGEGRYEGRTVGKAGDGRHGIL